MRFVRQLKVAHHKSERVSVYIARYELISLTSYINLPADGFRHEGIKEGKTKRLGSSLIVRCGKVGRHAGLCHIRHRERWCENTLFMGLVAPLNKGQIVQTKASRRNTHYQWQKGSSAMFVWVRFPLQSQLAFCKKANYATIAQRKR